MMNECGIIGGKSDGMKIYAEKGAVQIELYDEKYIAIQFPREPKKKGNEVIAYMRAGMTPVEAMKIWRDRNPCKPTKKKDT